RRLQEEVANAGASPHDEQVPPLEENTNVDKAPANPTPMMEAEMRNILAQMAKAMPSQAQPATVQSQSMMSQANRDTAPRSYQQVTSMTSRVRDFSRMNPPTFYGSKRDNRLLRDGPVTWDILKVAFLDRFFPREIREEKVTEFINLCQRGKSVHEFEEARDKRKSRDANRARSFVGGSSKSSLEIQDNTRLKKWVSNQVHSKFPRASDDRVSNLNSRSYGKSAHKMRDCPNLKSQDKGSVQAQSSGCSDAPKKNRFSNLRSKG
ncbi:hypothetical protein EJD97_009754, partial [Solanum chilense]